MSAAATAASVDSDAVILVHPHVDAIASTLDEEDECDDSDEHTGVPLSPAVQPFVLIGALRIPMVLVGTIPEARRVLGRAPTVTMHYVPALIKNAATPVVTSFEYTPTLSHSDAVKQSGTDVRMASSRTFAVEMNLSHRLVHDALPIAWSVYEDSPHHSHVVYHADEMFMSGTSTAADGSTATFCASFAYSEKLVAWCDLKGFYHNITAGTCRLKRVLVTSRATIAAPAARASCWTRCCARRSKAALNEDDFRRALARGALTGRRRSVKEGAYAMEQL